MPAAGYRYGTVVYHVDGSGNYWSSTPYRTKGACSLGYNYSGLNPQRSIERYYGLSVRLVQDYVEEPENPTAIDEIDSQKSKVESRKLIKNGQLLIEREGKLYTPEGRIVNDVMF